MANAIILIKQNHQIIFKIVSLNVKYYPGYGKIFHLPMNISSNSFAKKVEIHWNWIQIKWLYVSKMKIFGLFVYHGGSIFENLK